MGLTDKEIKEANDRLIQDRKKVKRPPAGKKVNDSLGDIMERLNRVAAETREAREAFDAWFDGSVKPDNPCPDCGNVLMVCREKSWRKSFENHRFGFAFNDCPDCREARNAELDREWLLEAGVPANMLHCTLGNWTPENENDRETVKFCHEFTSLKAGFFVLSGDSKGVGKSHLAVGLLRKARAGRFITQQEIVSKMRYNYNFRGGEDIIGALKATPFLVLDEVGFSSEGRDVLPALHEILNFRYGMLKKTVLTTNLDRKAFINAVGDRLADRIREALLAYRTIAGESKRKGRRNYYGK